MDGTSRRGERHFGTIEAALEFHASIVAILRKGAVPEGTSPESGFVYDDDEDEDDDECEAKDTADWWKE